MKKPVHRALRLENTVYELLEIESLLAQVSKSEGFDALTRGQRAKYQDVLSSLREIIADLAQDTSQEQLAS